jgi:hypothetical protein
MQALNARSKYRFIDPYSGKKSEMVGASLLKEGLEFDLAPMSSRVLMYAPE